MGSPAYMSPEQWVSAKDADARSDIWSLGAILYELLAGAAAFHADGLAQICRKVLTSAPASLRNHRADLPEGLEAVVLRCLAKEPADRYQSVAELAAALQPYAIAESPADEVHESVPKTERGAPLQSFSPTVEAATYAPAPELVHGGAAANAAVPPAAGSSPSLVQPQYPDHRTDQAEPRAGPRLLLWIGLALLALVAVGSVSALVAYSIGAGKTGRSERRSPKRDRPKRASSKKAHSKKTSAKPLKTPRPPPAAKDPPSFVKKRAAEARLCWGRLGKPNKIFQLVLTPTSSTVAMADPTSRSGATACSHTSGGPNVHTYSVGQTLVAHAFHFDARGFDVLRDVVTYAQQRHTGDDDISLISLQPMNGKATWYVRYAGGGGAYLFDLKGNYLQRTL